MSVRVRFAPSPTGPLHLGNARVAVVNRLFADKNGGTFVLRIEDTDEKRFDPSSESLIIKELGWLGIRPDEGPGFGGAFGPYRQTERRDTHAQIARRLLSEGKAYRCFCTDEMLEDERQQAAVRGRPPRYSGRCRRLSDSEIAGRARDPFAVRFKADFTEIRVRDLIHGEITFGPDAFGDFVIVRADGSPVFIFSSAADDCLMGITHVIRGEDHLPNTPRQILIHRALDHEAPIFAHLPLLVTETGEKIKKREGGFDLETLIDAGYVPEGVFNYLAAVGNPTLGDKRLPARDAITDRFDIGRIGSSAVKIEPEKILRINAQALKGLAAPELAERIVPILKAHGYDTDSIGTDLLVRFAEAVRENIATLTEAATFAPIFFNDPPPMSEASVSVLSSERSRSVISSFLGHIESTPTLTARTYREAVDAVSRETGLSGKDLYMPIRAALTGMEHGPALEGMIEILGKDRVIGRVRRVLSHTVS